MQAAAKQTVISGQEGFTLVEVIVSMFLMAIVFTAAFGSYFLGMNIIEDSRQEVRASQLIQSEMEAMRTMTWSDLELMKASEYIDPQGQFIAKYSDNFRVFRYKEDISATQKRITIWVWWANAKNMQTYRRFTTVFTKNGLNDYYYRQA